MCPYLRVSESRASCTACIGPYTEPSEFEQEYYCNTCSHSCCVWFVSGSKEVNFKDNAAYTFGSGSIERIEEVFAHSRI